MPAPMKAPDRIDAAQQAFVQVLTNPATWLPFVPLAAAYAFIGLPWWLCLPLALVMLVVVVGVWARRWPVLMERARTSLLKNYRDAENAGLYARITELANAMSHLPTKRLLYDLGEAVEIKLAVGETPVRGWDHHAARGRGGRHDRRVGAVHVERGGKSRRPRKHAMVLWPRPGSRRRWRVCAACSSRST